MDNDKFGRRESQGYISDIKAPAGPVTPPPARPVDRASMVQDYAALQAQTERAARQAAAPVPTSSVLADSDTELLSQLGSLDIVDEETPAKPAPTPFVSTGKSGKSKKMLIWIIAGVLFVLLAVAGYIYWSQYYNKDDNKTPATTDTSKQEQTDADASVVMKSISNNYGQYQVQPEQFASEDNYPMQYVTYDAEGRYYTRTPEVWNYYDLGDSPQLDSTTGQDSLGCDKTAFDSKYGSFFDFTQQAFEAAGFNISSPKSGAELKSGIYTQYNDCGSSLVAKNSTEICSVYLLESSDVKKDASSPAAKAVASVACTKLETVEPEITKIEEINQVLSSAGQTVKFNTQSLESIVYVKDSTTEDYKIAAYYLGDASDTPNYFYQKTGSNWAVANEPDQPLNCDTDNADIKAAFKGESCQVKDALSNTYVKSVF